jgi:hypothetical protein
MAAKRKPDLASLVQGAGSEIAPIQRGRGLAGMLSEDPAAAAAQDASLSTHDDMPTTRQADNASGGHTDKPASGHADRTVAPAAEPIRRVKSYRIRDDLAYQIDVLAAQQRRKVYELVEEALSAYLRQDDDHTEPTP